jgi:hypothetical protein
MRIAFIILLLFSPITFARPGDGVPPAQRRVQRGYHDRVGWHMVNGVWMQASGACNWSDLLRLSWRGEHLAVEVQPSEKALGLLRGGRTAAVEMGAAKDLYQIAAPEAPHQRNAPARPAAVNALPMRPGALEGYLTASELPEIDRFENPRPLRPKMLMASADILRVMAEGDVDGSPVSISFMSQGSAGVQMSVTALGVPESKLNFSIHAASLNELQQQHQSRVRKYLSPLLRVLTGDDTADLFAPGATDVYGAFTEIEPTPQATEAVREILPHMVDPDYASRMRALASLRKLVAPGVCAIVRLPRTQLAAQQILFIEQVMRENSRRAESVEDISQLSKLRDDPMFLIDCLEFPDARVRAASVRELNRVLNRTLDVDPSNAGAAARVAHQLRGELDRKKN